MLDTRMRSSRNPVLRYPIRVYQSDRASPTDTLTTDSPGKQRGAVGVASRRRLTLPLDKLHYISGVKVVQLGLHALLGGVPQFLVHVGVDVLDDVASRGVLAEFP